MTKCKKHYPESQTECSSIKRYWRKRCDTVIINVKIGEQWKKYLNGMEKIFKWNNAITYMIYHLFWISEMLTVTHIISYCKNSYDKKHIIPKKIPKNSVYGSTWI